MGTTKITGPHVKSPIAVVVRALDPVTLSCSGGAETSVSICVTLRAAHPWELSGLSGRPDFTPPEVGHMHSHYTMV